MITGFGDGVFSAITSPAHLISDEVWGLAEMREFFFGNHTAVNALGYKFSSVIGNIVGGASLVGGATAATFKYTPGLGPAGNLVGHPAYSGSTLGILQGGAGLV